jgi:sialidase-1
MSSIAIVDSGVIYRNPDPGHRYIAALFPHPLELPGGEFICAYNRGSALYATDLTFFLARSADGGRTWPSHDMLSDRSHDDWPYSYHDPFLSRMRDGTLVIGAFRADRSDPDRPMFNERTGGLLKVEPILLRSTDDGRTWSAPEPVSLPDGTVATPAAAIIELSDGRWFWPFDQWKDFDDEAPYQPRTLGFFSDDQGGTWGDMIAYADGAAAGKGFWHGKPIVLDNGRLLTLYWAADMRTGANLANHLCFGDASARRWSDPVPTNLPGQTSALVDLGSGQLCIVYTWREAEQPGIMAALSEDGGRIWDLDGQARLWDATGRDRLGVESLDTYPRSHDTIAFGAPAAARASDGEVYAAWWCMEAAIVHIRWARLRVVNS